MKRGQILVELAVLLPLLMLLVLGSMEAGFLLVGKAQQDRATSLVAQWSAWHPGEDWAPVAALQLPGCDVTVTSKLEGIVDASAKCVYHPVIFPGWDLLPISSRESAATLP